MKHQRHERSLCHERVKACGRSWAWSIVSAGSKDISKWRFAHNAHLHTGTQAML
jgi:hypothetical protein